MHLAPGVETLTITGAHPGARVRLEDEHGRPVLTVVADPDGNAHVAYVPSQHVTVATLDDLTAVVAEGLTLAPGTYVAIDEDSGERREAVRVLAVDDHPDPSLYDQELAPGFGYVTVRDGVTLSVLVRTPSEELYGPGPWPTVVEYSGYGPSNPDGATPGSTIANLLGFATVGVNVRGTGCSGGVFDLFSAAQSADGYDVIETVARQPWVLHGHVGMVGLSYPGNTQLFVAATRPPSLACITPLSVLDDLWRQQWPGGTYNSGFTRAWLSMRDAETKKGGMTWDQLRIDGGDAICAANQEIRSLALDFASFGRAMDRHRPAMAARRAADLVHRIDVPVFLSGSWQDEQTGSRFALMLDRFEASPHTVFTMMNGHHPDGYSPTMIARFFEFLSFYVARRVPQIHPLIRELAPAQFAEHFGYTEQFEADRFGDVLDDYDAALARYRTEPAVRLLFESGAAHQTVGAPGHRYDLVADTFPPPETEARRWWFGPGGRLIDDAPTDEGADRYLDDPDAGECRYALTDVFDDFIRPQVPIEWSHFDDECTVAYETTLDEVVSVVGQGHVDLWLRPGTEDTSLQVTLTEVRPDGHEVRVQSGWHRPVHAVEDPTRSDELRVDHTFLAEHHRPLVVGEWHRTRVALMPVAHVFRAGSAVRITVSTPGRDQPFWCFENPVVPGAGHDVGRGGARASSLVLPVVPGDLSGGLEAPAPGALRGQPARPARPIANRAAPS